MKKDKLRILKEIEMASKRIKPVPLTNSIKKKNYLLKTGQNKTKTVEESMKNKNAKSKEIESEESKDNQQINREAVIREKLVELVASLQSEERIFNDILIQLKRYFN